MRNRQRARKVLEEEEINRRIDVYLKCNCSANQAAKELGITRRTMDKFLDRYGEHIKHSNEQLGEVDQTLVDDLKLPKEGANRYLLTCAQSNTKVHPGFFRNLKAFAKEIDAEIKISRFTYNRAAYTKGAKAGSQVPDEELSFDKAIAPFISDEIQRLAPSLTWCGNLQISPTAATPLSGFQDYTGESSSVIPHPRIAMQPVPRHRNQPPKHLYTTGACTLKNYIMAKAGQKAEFHHSFGALLVEVLPDGTWFARQVVADEEGTFQDHPYRVRNGRVSKTASVTAIQWGDVHVANMDPAIRAMFWGEGGVLDTLKPKYQIFHDLVDGESHNHHSQKDHHHQFMLAQEGKNDIREEFDAARKFVDEEAYREWCQGIIVWSNHDEFIKRYLRESDYRRDHTNAEFILELELEAYRRMREGLEPQLFAQALNSRHCEVLTDDGDPYNLEGVSIPFHGDKGANGARGSVRQFSRQGMKTMTGHSHAAHWDGGATSAGTCTKLDMGYNKGPSSWSHTFTVLYEGGKRAQFTANAETGLWRGPLSS